MPNIAYIGPDSFSGFGQWNMVQGEVYAVSEENLTAATTAFPLLFEESLEEATVEQDSAFVAVE